MMAHGAHSMTKSNLYVPPEEAEHELTFMQWPVSRKVYSERYFLEDVQRTIADIANAIFDALSDPIPYTIESID